MGTWGTMKGLTQGLSETGQKLDKQDREERRVNWE